MSEVIQCYGIRASRDEIIYIESEEATIVVARQDIKTVHINRGFTAEHPIAQCLFALVLLAVGLFTLPHLVQWFLRGGEAWDWEFMLLLLVPIALWLGREGLKRGLFLELELVKGRRKVPFSGAPSDTEISSFKRHLREDLSYPMRS